ncbi:hypothetical protein GW17_00036671 [Ensete ventricosum]|nr:hypothetical protein GW17_00036671 [Ensete ventricosum]
MEKHPHETNEPRISFKAEEVKYPNHDDTLVISICVANMLLKRVTIDTDSSIDILHYDTF